MNKKIKKIIATVLVGITLCSIPLRTKASDIMFSNSTMQEGLTQGTIRAMFQDSNGYIWIGTTDGLNMYNGYEYKNFNKGVNSENSLVSGFISSINEDKNKNLWIGTSNGISRLNLIDKSVQNYHLTNDNLNSGEVSNISIDANNNILVATLAGLYVYEEETDEFVLSKYSEGSYSTLFAEGEYIYGASNQTLFRYNVETDEYVDIVDDEIKEIIENDFIYDIYVDNNTIYIGTATKGLYKYNMESGIIEDNKRYLEDEKAGRSYSIRKVYKDKENNIILGTANGLVVYPESGEEKVYTNDYNDKYSLVNNGVLSILQDESGLIWVGTYSGLSIFKPGEGISYYCTINNGNGLLGNIVHGIYEDFDNKIWIGSYDKGISILDRENNTYEYLTSSMQNGLSSNLISDITGNEEKIFVATNDGINIIDRKTRKIEYIREGLNSNYCIGVDIIDDKLYVGTTSGTNIIDLNDYSVSSLDSLYESLGVRNYLTGTFFKDTNNMLWIGLSLNGGLIKYDPATGESRIFKAVDGENSISDNSIADIDEDEQGNLWIGTSNGLNKYDKEKDEFTVYSTEDGILNNTIYGVEYSNDHLWISTNVGVESLCVNDSDENFLVREHIKNKEFNSNACIELHDGQVAFGSIDGLFILDPYKIKDDNYVPRLKYNYLKVNGIDVNDVDSMKLDYENSSISINLFTTKYDNSKKTKYFYKIDNISSEWRSIEGNEITFSNLAPGKYKIKFKALCSNGIYSNEESISFKVKPPFWRSMFAVFIYIAALLSFLLYIGKKIKEMDKTIEQRNVQLNKETEEKNELLLKVLKIEQRKNNYLINISHELRTPLNVMSSIQQLIQTLNNKDELRKEDINKYMDMFGKNLKRLLKLINDLMDSSKIDSGKFKLFKEEKNIVYIVEDSVMSLQNLTHEKNINLVFDTEIEECMMSFDVHAIDRCIVNLVNNAIKFTEIDGEILVYVEDDEKNIKISVKDSGCGIAKENLKNIFDKFNQGYNSKKEAAVGSGLGLTITKRLINLHKGEIYVESEENVGSTFTIILPKVIKE